MGKSVETVLCIACVGPLRWRSAHLLLSLRCQRSFFQILNLCLPNQNLVSRQCDHPPALLAIRLGQIPTPKSELFQKVEKGIAWWSRGSMGEEVEGY